MRASLVRVLTFLLLAPPLALAQRPIAHTAQDSKEETELSQIRAQKGPEAYQKALRRRAEHGSTYAQLALGMERLTPPPPPHPFPGLVRPPEYPPLDDAEAIHWLQLASAGGSGQASEIIAQACARGAAPGLQAQDASRFHSLAVQQGYDLQLLAVRCYRLVHDRADLGCANTRRAAVTCPDAGTLAGLSSLGAQGTLVWQGESGGSPAGLLSQPVAEPAVAIVVLDHPPMVQASFPEPLHTTGLYLQTADGWQSDIENVAHTDRLLTISTPHDPYQMVSTRAENIEGNGGGGSCVLFDPPLRAPRGALPHSPSNPPPGPQAPQSF